MEEKFKLLPTSCRVTLTTRNGSVFTGTLQYVNEATGKIVLKSVMTAGAKLYGPQNFYKSDVIHMQVLNEPDGVNRKAKSVPKKNECPDFERNDAEEKVQCHSIRVENADGDECSNEKIIGEDIRDQGIGDDSFAENDGYYEGNGYIFIHRMCEQFFDAIVHIMNQEVVGVTFEGVNIGRDGTLSLVQISTESEIIIFDMLQLGDKAFVEGLQAVFEASDIVKVIHDCRWISDMMHERYKIGMVNIFDTQVADAFIYRSMHNGGWPKHVDSLSSCLIKHLNLPLDVNFLKSGRQNYEAQSVCLQRPLPDKIFSMARKNVSHLIQLYKVLSNKLLLEFRLGVNLYLNHVSNLNGDIESCIMNKHLLPPVFLEIPKLVSYNSVDNTVQNHTKSFQDARFNTAENPAIFDHDTARHRSNGSGMSRTDSKSAADKNRPFNNSDCEDKHLIHYGNTSKVNSGVPICGSNVKGNSISESSRNKLNSATLQDNISYLKGDIITVSPEQLSSGISDSKRHLKRCQAVHTDQNHEMPELSNYLATPTDHSDHQDIHSNHQDIHSNHQDIHSDHQDIHSNHQDINSNHQDIHSNHQDIHFNHQDILTDSGVESDMLQDKLPENGMNIRKALQNLANLRKAHLAELANRKTECNESVVAPHQIGVQDTVDASSSPKSILRDSSCSNTDRSFAKDMDVCSFVPAGFGNMTVSKKRMKGMQMMSKPQDSHELHETTFPPTLSQEEDFSCIPMQSSLNHRQELPLGVTFCGVGDLLYETECSLEQSENQESSINSYLACGDQNSVKDTGIEHLQQSKMFKKVLKMVSSSVLCKLLPPKTSPRGNSTSSRTN